MTLPTSRGPLAPEDVRAALIAARESKQRVAVCSTRPVHVTYDQHGGEPIRPEGDYVGAVLRVDRDTFVIGGWSFNTVLYLDGVAGIWPRDESPNPCICGKHYEREPLRAVALTSPVSQDPTPRESAPLEPAVPIELDEGDEESRAPA